MKLRSLCILAAAASLLAALGWQLASADGSPPVPSILQPQPDFHTSPTPPTTPMEPVRKSSEEWKKILSAEQYRVMREAGTERPGGEIYKQFKKQGEGTYFCAGCGNQLFRSKEKFDSGCGWPSFYDPATATGVKERTDSSLGMKRVEVLCSMCDAHLGHVFSGEGFPTPTDKRYCINGVALHFVPSPGSAGAASAAGQ